MDEHDSGRSGLGESIVSSVVQAVGALGGDPAAALVGAVAGPMLARLAAIEGREWLQVLGVARARRVDLVADDIAAALTDDERAALMARFSDDPRLVDLVLDTFATAEDIADDDHRRLLGRVVASALRGADGTTVDEADYLRRTIRDLQPIHLRVLTRIATPRLGSGPMEGLAVDGGMRTEDLVEDVGQGQRHLLSPILAVLVRWDLIHDDVQGRNAIGGPSLRATDFGRRLLEFVGDGVDLNHADVGLRLDVGHRLLWLHSAGPAPLIVQHLQ